MDQIIRNIEDIRAALAEKRDAAGRSEEGRLLAVLTTEAEKLKALAIGFGLE